MAEPKAPIPPAPTGTQAAPENPALANLKDREKVLVEKLASLDKMDANEQARGNVDINEVKRRTQLQLTEIRKAIEKAK